MGFQVRTGLCNSVHRRYVRQFFLESSKEFIPENKYLTKVFIKVFFVDGMMHPVMRWCNNDFFEEAHVADMLRMIPELRK